MPVNSTLYNDALQQLMFLYTVDYKPWQIAEGRIVHIPIDGVVSIRFEGDTLTFNVYQYQLETKQFKRVQSKSIYI